MTFLLALLLATPATGPVPADADRFDRCAALVQKDAAAAVAMAEDWQRNSGGLPARLCLGLGYVAQERWAPAEIAFAQAAVEADIHGDARAAGLWVQAGNAALAGDDPGKARSDLDHALALPATAGAMRGEAYLDRARAGVAAGDTSGARQDLDTALTLVPRDPLAWLLSATLARRQGDGPRAAKDVAEAQRLDPIAPEIAAEAVRIAAMGAGPKP